MSPPISTAWKLLVVGVGKRNTLDAARTIVSTLCVASHWWKTPVGVLQNNITNKKPACPFCGGGSPKILFQGDVTALMKLKGGDLLKGEYKDARTEFEFKCPNGHDAKRNWNKLQQGYFCKEPNCEHESRRQISLGEIRQHWKPADFVIHEFNE